MTTLIDAHGEDHGLRVTLDLEAREVEITQWAELCEPDENGDRHPHLHHTTMTLRHCLEAAQDSGRRGHKSQHDRVITGALRALFL